MSEEQQQNPQGQEDFKQEENAPINVKVVSSTGDEVFFKIKRNTKLSKLQGAYATKVGKDVSSIRFLCDGARINDDDTPASLDMEDNDTIDVMVERAHLSSSFGSFLTYDLIVLSRICRGWRFISRIFVQSSPIIVTLPSICFHGQYHEHSHVSTES
ncbi:ubiquitin-like protein [Rhizopogon vinicolor AM-OR11-026]|uniref:Ubiquitin-like protein n=1 Tax=Rhizopogon vinicolor AM-OR11-026 TaxID=1314800 RepID=A0A1B7MMM8_9AGAM|nr:ubiquitin-like protein [Rhizopogon vinicolor AM-OR11-026]